MAKSRAVLTVVFGSLVSLVPLASGVEAQNRFTCNRTERGNGGFTLVCNPAGGGSGRADFAIQNVRQYDARIDVANWIYFDLKANRDFGAFRMTVRIHYPNGTFSNCTEYVRAMEAGEVDDGLVIPDHCGRDNRWSAVQFIKPPGRTCSGCRRYNASDLPFGRGLLPGSTGDALELQTVLEEFEYAHQTMGF